MYAETANHDSEESYLQILIINSMRNSWSVMIFYSCKVLSLYNHKLSGLVHFLVQGQKGVITKCYILIQRTLGGKLWNIYVVSNNRENIYQFKCIGKYDEILLIYFFDPQADPPVLNRNGSTIENVHLTIGHGDPIQLLLKFVTECFWALHEHFYYYFQLQKFKVWHWG